MNKTALTKTAYNEIITEQNFTPEEVLPFLTKRGHFMSVQLGITRELERLGYDITDKQHLLTAFEKLLNESKLIDKANARKWLIGGNLPSAKSKHNVPIKLCFIFRLKGTEALEFLYKVCRVNGFNFRRAKDVVYFYCLENDMSYEQATNLIDRYNNYEPQSQYIPSDATKRTHALRSTFGNLQIMAETTFFDLLCANKRNFIGYSETAHSEFKRLHDKLKTKLKDEIDDYYKYVKHAGIDKDAGGEIEVDFSDGINDGVNVFKEILYVFDKIFNSNNKKTDTPFADIVRNFPQVELLRKILRVPSAATDIATDTARKIFILVFFADYDLDPPPNEKFGDFVYALNSTLDECGYAPLYHANPYDWLIQKCAKSLDILDPTEDDNPLELYNDILGLLAEQEL